MTRIETPYDSEGATRLAQVALELDSSVTGYKESEIAGAAWLAVTDAPDEPRCARCGARFDTHSSCPDCGADRIGLNTIRLPDRFTVGVTETDSGSTIEVTAHGGPDETPDEFGTHSEFVSILQRLRDEHDDIESAEAELLQRSGGFLKESEQLTQQPTQRSDTDTGSNDGTVALDLIKIYIAFTVIATLIGLGFILMVM